MLMKFKGLISSTASLEVSLLLEPNAFSRSSSLNDEVATVVFLKLQAHHTRRNDL